MSSYSVCQLNIRYPSTICHWYSVVGIFHLTFVRLGIKKMHWNLFCFLGNTVATHTLQMTAATTTLSTWATSMELEQSKKIINRNGWREEPILIFSFTLSFEWLLWMVCLELISLWLGVWICTIVHICERVALCDVCFNSNTSTAFHFYPLFSASSLVIRQIKLPQTWEWSCTNNAINRNRGSFRQWRTGTSNENNAHQHQMNLFKPPAFDESVNSTIGFSIFETIFSISTQKHTHTSILHAYVSRLRQSRSSNNKR